MKKITAALAFVVLLGSAVVAPAESVKSENKTSVAVQNFDVFVDPPTGYTFVKLPSGWKFVGKVEQSDLSNLPPAVITSLLPGRIEGIDRQELKAANAAANL